LWALHTIQPSPTIASFLWLCHLCTRDSTMAILSWSGFRLISRGTSSLFLTPRLVWFIDCVVMTTSRTPLQHWLRLPERVDFNFQGGTHGFSRAARSCSTLLESADPRRRPARSSPTSFIVVTTTASSTIPSVYTETSLVSRSSIRPLELLATGHSVIVLFTCFASTVQDISFP